MPQAAPLNYFFHSAGPAARPAMVLGWVFAGICCVVCLIVLALLLRALWRLRGPAYPGEIGPERGGVKWVYIGTGISTLVLFGMAVYALIILNQLAHPPRKAGVTITVTAYDWWWKAVYDAADGRPDVVTANEIHIPVGVPIRIELNSADVIHAFWVPMLAGKTQMIPGTTNEQWLQADRPGIYRGQCTQFCGAQHAHMAFEVVAQTPSDYERWLTAQRRPASAVGSGVLLPGWKVFAANCAACHAIRGTSATGDHAPDLTHLNSRRMLAAGTLANTPDNLMRWIEHAQQIKPESLMPSIKLSPADARDLSVYLATLK